MADNVTFHNYGGSYGSQIGKAEGDVHISMDRDGQPSDLSLVDHVTALRRALDAAHAQSQVDDGTYVDAQQALDEAAQLTEPADEEQKNAFIRALRKLKGLVEDVSGLAGAVASLISVVTGRR
jgi:8-oxo-dGTP diphosphatase